MVRRIAVSILSQSQLMREALGVRLSRDSQFAFGAVASTVRGLRAQLQKRPTEVLLVYGDIEAFAASVDRDIKLLLPVARLIALGFHPTRDRIEARRWIEAGASAYLRCATSYRILRKTICEVAASRPPRVRNAPPRVVRRPYILAEVD
jgi:hypothetical protein